MRPSPTCEMKAVFPACITISIVVPIRPPLPVMASAASWTSLHARCIAASIIVLTALCEASDGARR